MPMQALIVERLLFYLYFFDIHPAECHFYRFIFHSNCWRLLT